MHLDNGSDRINELLQGRLQIASEAAEIGIWDWDLLTDEIQAVGHERLFGLAAGCFDGRYETFLSYVHPDDRAGVAQAIQQSRQLHSVYQYEYRVIWQDGSVHWIEGRGQFYYDDADQPMRMAGILTRIDDRKQVEEALRQSEARYRLLFENNPNPMWVYDCETWKFLAVNPAAIQHYGYTLDEFLSMTIADLRLPEDLPALRDRTARLSEQCDSHTGESRHRKKDGTLIEVEITSNAIVWSGAAARCVLIQDITDRKQAEAKLAQIRAELETRVAARTARLTELNDRLQRELFERYQAQQKLQKQAQLLDLAHDTIMTLDLNCKITFWNHGAETMYGWSKEEALVATSYKLLQTQFPQPLSQIKTMLLQVGYWEGELTQQKRDGTPLVVASRWVLQRNKSGQPIAILEINNNITLRKRMEEALRESEERFRHAFDHASIGMALISLDGAWLKVNPALCGLIGYSEVELLTTTLQTLTHPDDLDNDAQSLCHLLHHEIRSYEIEKRCFHQQGQIIWLSFSISLVQTPEAEPLYLIAQIQDITLRREVERMKDEFISVVSHELRTPLTSIRGSLGLLASGALQHHPDRAQRMIEIAAIDSERLVRLVNDILDLERLESGKVTLTLDRLSAEELMQRSVEAMRSLAVKENITLTVLPTSAQVWASADHIIQTLTNILSNAIKFSAPGGTVWLKAEIARVGEIGEIGEIGETIRISSPSSPSSPSSFPLPSPIPPPSPHPPIPPSSHSILFSIVDQGRGIPPDKLTAVFGRFQQVDASDSREKAGTGLGLAICQSIVQQHGGQIWVESTLGEGSCFYFTLPACLEE